MNEKENLEEEFEIEEVDLLRVQHVTEKQQRLQYTIKDLYQELQEAQKKAQAAKTEFERKYTEDNKYKIVSIDENKYIGKRVLIKQDESAEPEEFNVIVDEDSTKEE